MFGGAGTSPPEVEPTLIWPAAAFGLVGGGPLCQCAWLGS